MTRKACVTDPYTTGLPAAHIGCSTWGSSPIWRALAGDLVSRRCCPMAIAADQKSKLVGEYRIHDKDTGSPEVQIALLTQRINDLRAHFDTHKKDHSSRRGLLKLVSRRNQLLKYLTREDRSRYQQIIGRLGLRK